MKNIYDVRVTNNTFTFVQNFNTLGEAKRYAKNARIKSMHWVKVEVYKNYKKMYDVIEKALEVEFVK